MNRVIRYLLLSLLSIVLMAGSADSAIAQKKTTTTPAKTTTTQKKSTTTTQKKAATPTQTKKPAQQTSKKPAAATAKKPAQQTQKKSGSTAKGSTSAKTSAKGTSSSKTGSKGKGTKNSQPKSRQAYEKQQRDLQRQISDTEKLISNNNQTVRSQNRDIKIREDEIKKRQALINSKQQEIATLVAEEDSLQREIRGLEKNHAATKEKYAAAMRHLYKWRSGYNELLFVFSANNLLEGMRRMRYLRKYGQWRKEQATLLEQQRKATVQAREALQQTRSVHETVLKDIDRERASLTRKQQEQQAQMADLQKRNKELQNELERDRKQMAEVERTIQRMIEEEIRRAEEARRKEEARRREAAAKKQKASGTTASGGASSRGTGSSSGKPSGSGGTIAAPLVAEAQRLTGSFASNQGKMPYPVDANFVFVDRYNPSNGNSSIVLSTKVGAHACAIYAGTVEGCFATNEEWTVIVVHGAYRSVYTNLKNVSVRKGQKVTIHQQLGTLKTEPDGNRAELRFWIYKDKSTVNPERWLRR